MDDNYTGFMYGACFLNGNTAKEFGIANAVRKIRDPFMNNSRN